MYRKKPSRRALGSGDANNSSRNSSNKDGDPVAAVAVDADKSSQYALKWAGDHILSGDNMFLLLPREETAHNNFISK